MIFLYKKIIKKKVLNWIFCNYYLFLSFFTVLIIVSFINNSITILLACLLIIGIIVFKYSAIYVLQKHKVILFVLFAFLFFRLFSFYYIINTNKTLTGRIIKENSKFYTVSVYGFPVRVWKQKEMTYELNDVVLISGGIKTNEKVFKYGVVGTAEIIVSKVRHGNSNKWSRYLSFKSRLNTLYKRLLSSYEENSISMLFGMLFGSDYLTPDVKLHFMQLGLIHIAAVSGYNVSVVIAMFEYFLRKTRRSVQNYVLLFLTVYFVNTIGFEPPIIRAGLSSILGIVLRGMGYPVRGWETFWGIFFLMIIWYPFWVFSISFHLTMIATFTVKFIARWIVLLLKRAIYSIKKNVGRFRFTKVSKILGVTFLREYIMMTFLVNTMISIYFRLVHIYPQGSFFYTILNNIIVLPLVDLFTPIGYMITFINIMFLNSGIYNISKYLFIFYAPLLGIIELMQ